MDENMLENGQYAHQTADQPSSQDESKYYNIQRSNDGLPIQDQGQMVPTINVIPSPFSDLDEAQNVSNDAMGARKRDLKEGASTFAGFLYWANFIGVVFLLIGFVAPGWMTVKSHQTIFREYETYNQGSYVIQDYSLWYITQCVSTGAKLECDTFTYRLIDAAYSGTCGACEKLEIGSFETTDFMVLSGAGLVFSYSQFVRAQALYTLGVVIAVFTLREFRTFRKNVNEEKDTKMSKKKWLFHLALGVASACFVFVPIFMFLLVYGSIGRRDASPLGSIFAGLGGLMITVMACAIFLQLACCWNSEEGVYICSAEPVNGKLEVEEEEDDDEEV